MKPQANVEELINVHRVRGPKAMIAYLRLADQEMTEGLFFQAKRTGRTSFVVDGKSYDLTKNKDGSFTLALSEDQAFITEEYS